GEEGSPVPGDFVCLTIKDTGEGMTEEVAARVFEPFFTTKGVGRGTGLGLSQVYGFARSSHGHVEAESRPGQGTTVSIHLPRSHKPLSAVEPTPGPRRAAGRAKGRVLMVEDDDAVASMVSQMLAQLGYRASRASTADAALKVLEADQKFDLVFSDMVMPGDMDGRALAREIRRLYPHLPVLLTTGYSEAAAQAAGDGLRLLMKPYRIDALAAAVKAARNEAGTSAASA
ncbi:MAG TPA: response regulator, partial [Caulobacteraceae bacterium]|nr:response regulator [Caulobacteraceae bacterium]